MVTGLVVQKTHAQKDALFVGTNLVKTGGMELQINNGLWLRAYAQRRALFMGTDSLGKGVMEHQRNMGGPDNPCPERSSVCGQLFTQTGDKRAPDKA